MEPHSDSIAPTEIPRRFTLAGVEVEPEAGRIGGRHIDPKAMGVLVHLVQRAQHTVAINELLDVVWPRASVHDNVVHRAVSRLRRALRDRAGSPTFIETVPRRGYRLIVASRTDDSAPYRSEQPKSVLGGALEHPSKRSIAVAPFEFGARVAQYSGLAFAEALADALGPTHWQVVGPERVASVATRVSDSIEAGVALGVGYLLTGRAVREGRNLALAARMCCCPTGVQIWTGHWSGPPGEFQRMRAKLVRAIAQAAYGRAVRNERLRHRGTGEEESSPWWLLYRAGEVELGAQRIALGRRALALDPDFAPAHALLASTLAHPGLRGSKRRRQRESKPLDRHHLDRALQLAPDDFEVLRECSMAARFHGDLDLSLTLARRAYAISPLAADVLGTALINTGQVAEGLTLLEEAAQEPWELLGDGIGFWASGGHPKIRLAHAYCRLGRFADALQVCNDFHSLHPYAYDLWMKVLKVNLLAQIGRIQEAKNLYSELSEALSHWQIDDFEQLYADMAGCPDPQSRPADLGRYVDGLRRVLPGNGCSAAVSDETMPPS
jgi:DNA-binding winged helix-turn-helix (wHTH) protein